MPRAGAGRERTRAPLPLPLLAALGALFLALPPLGLALRAPWRSALSAITAPTAVDALRLSLETSLAATAVSILLGVPLAWVQARLEFPGRSLLRAVTTLPLVLPPVVGGVALLLAFGRHGLLGEPMFSLLGLRLPFTTAGVVLAEAFVAMPFVVITVEAGVRSIDRRLEEAAAALGAHPWRVFWRITLPMGMPSIFAGALLAWSRALGEFGATITFAGSLPGTTQTMPLAVYALLETDPDAAVVMSLVLVGVSLLVLVGLRDRFLRVA